MERRRYLVSQPNRRDVRNGIPDQQLDIYNEGEYGAKSTFTAILGREACYSGKVIRWDELLTKGRELAPGIDGYTLDTPPPTLPDPETGEYPVPVPGKYNPFA